MHISPRSPCGTVWSGSSTEWISIRVSGKGMPMDPSLLVPVMGLQVATGEVSERPYPYQRAARQRLKVLLDLEGERSAPGDAELDGGEIVLPHLWVSIDTRV